MYFSVITIDELVLKMTLVRIYNFFIATYFLVSGKSHDWVMLIKIQNNLMLERS